MHTHIKFKQFHQLDEDNVAKLLIGNKADVNAKDLGGSTPLHWTAQHGNFQVLKLQFFYKFIPV